MSDFFYAKNTYIVHRSININNSRITVGYTSCYWKIRTISVRYTLFFL